MGCDAGNPDVVSYHGPFVHVVGVNVGPGRPMPEDGVIQIAFDRYLLPSTVTRQSIAIVDASNRSVATSQLPVVTYDPIARTATLAPPTRPWLTKGQVYKLFLGVPDDDSDLGGVRAIDRATLDPDEERLIAFVVGQPSGRGSVEPPVDFCRDVLPIFQAKCSRAGCHSDDANAASGLSLASPSGVAATAIGRVAVGAHTGGRANEPAVASRVFGADMARIDPGNPGQSWLLYKVELAETPAGSVFSAPKIACDGAAGTPLVPYAPYAPLVPVTPASPAERARLSDAVLGSAMPFPTHAVRSYAEQALTFDEREILRRWVASLGPTSNVPECGTCAAE